MTTWPPLVIALALLFVAPAMMRGSGMDHLDLLPGVVVFDTSDWIVEGTIARTEPAGERAEFAVLAVTRVHRGPADVREIRIRQVQAAHANTATRRVESGARGFWIHNTFRGGARPATLGPKGAAQPESVDGREIAFWPESTRAEFEKTLAERAALPGGEPVQGLALRLETFFESPFVSGPAYELLVSLKNVSDRPIRVCVDSAHKPLAGRWLRPDGTERALEVYPLDHTRGEDDERWVTIAPGAVAFVWPLRPPRGIVLVTPPNGEHKLRVTFRVEPTASGAGAGGGWSGTATSNEVVFRVP